MSENLYGDLLKIARGDVSVAEERVGQFRDYANTVSRSTQSGRDSSSQGSSGEQGAERHGASESARSAE